MCFNHCEKQHPFFDFCIWKEINLISLNKSQVEQDVKFQNLKMQTLILYFYGRMILPQCQYVTVLMNNLI